MKRVQLVLNFNKANPDVRNIIKEIWPILQIKDSTKEVFSEQHLFAYRCNKNLKELLVRTAFTFPPKNPGISGKSTQNALDKCKKDNCSLCPWINNCRTFYSTYTRRRYKKNYIGDCRTSNIIYLITCLKCGQQYVGKSKRQFRERLGENLRFVRNKSAEPTGKHFNQAGHNIHDMSFEIIEVLWNNPDDPL